MYQCWRAPHFPLICPRVLESFSHSIFAAPGQTIANNSNDTMSTGEHTKQSIHSHPMYVRLATYGNVLIALGVNEFRKIDKHWLKQYTIHILHKDSEERAKGINNCFHNPPHEHKITSSHLFGWLFILLPTICVQSPKFNMFNLLAWYCLVRIFICLLMVTWWLCLVGSWYVMFMFIMFFVLPTVQLNLLLCLLGCSVVHNQFLIKSPPHYLYSIPSLLLFVCEPLEPSSAKPRLA